MKNNAISKKYERNTFWTITKVLTVYLERIGRRRSITRQRWRSRMRMRGR
jgi:hypothetical protein